MAWSDDRAAPAAERGDEAAPPLSWRGWLVVCGVLGGGSIVAWWLPSSWLDWQPERALAEPWRFVSAAWVHWSEGHLGANVVAVAVVAALGMAARLPARAAVALATAWPLTHAGLWVQPALAHYGGASGVLHAAVAVAACWLLVRARGRARLIGAMIAAGLVLKVLLEQPWAGPLASTRTWDIAVAPIAHASGALAGAAAAAVALALQPAGRGVPAQ